MRPFHVLLTAVLVAAVSGAAIAQTMEATPIPAPPKPNLSSLAFLAGTWSCTYRSARRPTPMLSTQIITLDPGGRWIVEKTISKGASWFPYPAVQTDLVTYDVGTKRWADVESDSLGGYDLSVSSGWTGNTMVWKDLAFVPQRDVVSASDTTMKKISASKFSWTSTFTTTKGRIVGTAAVCTKG